MYNALGYGYSEKVYQKALAEALKKENLKYTEQLYCPIVFNGVIVGKNFFDFLIEDMVILEIKKGNYFAGKHIDQVYQYLVSKNLELGILAYFAPQTVHIKRIVNLK